MTLDQKIPIIDPLYISRSRTSTESNKTGSWRFLRPRYDEKTAPCSAECPAGEDIGRIEMLTAQGMFKEAWETILAENPFPSVCGRVCYHPCESVCNRKDFDDPIAIHTIERFLADTAIRYDLKPVLERLPDKQQKIAVIGAGPAGLSAACFLARLGYRCDVYEAMPEPGGVLRWGIPLYRLPTAALKKEIAQVEALGVRIHCGKPVTQAFLEEARGSYDAVFLGCGHSRGRKLLIPGEELLGSEDGLQWLQKVRAGEIQGLRGQAVILGGGNTAIDVARSLRRLGAKALLVYRRRRQDMPAFEHEVAMALEEGVELWELWAPEKIEREGEDFLLTLHQMQVSGQDEQGRALLMPAPEKTQTIRVQHIFRAIGAEVAEPWTNPPGTRGVSDGNFLELSNCLLVQKQDLPVLVYGGDLVARIKSVVHAVASGKQAAMALDVLFQEGLAAVAERLQECVVGGGPALSMEIYLRGRRCQRNPHIVHYEEINTDYFQFAPRIVQPRLLREERLESFSEIDLKISGNLAIREAERCFNCGLCNQCDNCRLFCPEVAVIQEESPQGRRIDYDYCKGCGLCVVECPRNAMALEEEQS